MKDKLVIKAKLSYKPENFESENCVVEKVLEIPEKEFRRLKTRPFENNKYIAENRELMYADENSRHCLLLIGSESDDGILVESEGANYARYAQFIPCAKDIVYSQEVTESEREIHNFFHDRINNIIEKSSSNLNISFSDLFGDPICLNTTKRCFIVEESKKPNFAVELLGSSVTLVDMMFRSWLCEIASDNPAVEYAEMNQNDIIIEKKEHGLGIGSEMDLKM